MSHFGGEGAFGTKPPHLPVDAGQDIESHDFQIPVFNDAGVLKATQLFHVDGQDLDLNFAADPVAFGRKMFGVQEENFGAFHVFHGQAQVNFHQLFQAFQGIVVISRDIAEGFEKLQGQMLQDGHQEAVLISEIVVNIGNTRAMGLGDIPNGGSGVSVGGNQFHGDFEKAFFLLGEFFGHGFGSQGFKFQGWGLRLPGMYRTFYTE